jgi:tricorn protease
LWIASREGGAARRLTSHVGDELFPKFSPDGTKIAYLETSQEFRTWKRYRGGWSLPIAIYDLKKNTHEELPKTAGMDMFPMGHGNSIYFISDRDGIMNLYSYDLTSKQTKKFTDYQEFDIKWPSLGPDAIVYENGGLLYEYNLDSGKTRDLPIVVPAEDIEARPEFKSVGDNIGSAALSPSGVRAVVEARGNIFTVPAEHGSVRTLTTEHSSIHELNPGWSPDGKWIAYLSDKTGEYELYTRPQMGGDETRITTDGKIYRFGPTWSPDSKKLVYWDKSNQLWYVSVDDNNPVFDDNGKLLYFISTRYFYPSIGQLDQRLNYYSTDGVFAVTLKADEPSPFKPESDEEKAADENKDKKKDDRKTDAAKSGDQKSDEQKEEKKPEPVKPIQIHLDGIATRVVPVPIPAGILSSLLARKDKFFYISTPMEARQFGMPEQGPKNVLHVYDLTKREDKVWLEGIEGYDLDKEGKKVLYKAGPVLGITDAGPGRAKVGEGKLDLGGMQVQIDPREEWRQIYHEAWRIERDFYWDPNMTGHDWNKIGARYEALLPWVAHRSDLNYLIGELIAELSTSHTYVGGGDQPKKPQVSVGMLGADYQVDGGFYSITKIYPGENWNDATRSPLTEPGLKVKSGDYLISVNGQEARATQDVYSYFQNLAGKTHRAEDQWQAKCRRRMGNHRETHRKRIRPPLSRLD